MPNLTAEKTTVRENQLTVKAYAKINLALDIIGKRPDGYHEVAMIMQSVNLFDEITLRKEPDGISLTTDHPELLDERSNLAYLAAALLKDYCQVNKGVHITIKKNIPLAAGLAGGSADAAAVLLGLAKLWGLSVTSAQLSNIGAKLGSDVPFCLCGGTMLSKGRGEIVTPLAPLPKCYAVLVKPPLSVSTAWAYGQYRADRVKARPDIEAMCAALKNKDIKSVCSNLLNVLETVTCQAHPEINLIKKRMLKYKAEASLMSGSGPTVFGLTADEEKAKDIFEKFKSDSSHDYEIYMVETVSSIDMP